MPNCQKCGKEIDRRGLLVHERWCKGTIPVTDIEDSPEVVTAKKVLHPPKAKKKAVKVRLPIEEMAEEDPEEEEEQEPEEYTSQQINPLWYLLVLLPLAAIAYLWYKLQGKEE